MNMLKRSLAMFLVLCMIIGMVPFNTFATEASEETTAAAEVTEIDETLVNNEDTTEEPADAGDSTETADESAATEEATHAAETTVATEEATDATEEATEEASEATEESTEATEAATEAIEETTEATEDIFAVLTADLINEVAAAAITLGTKPADSTVTDQPFDTNVSKNHRIPGLVNHKGTLIASADARWDNEKDGGGLDVVVSRSTDGKNWSYTYAGYLGDNGNIYNNTSSTLIDPLIVSDGNTLYLFSDLFPAGYSLSTGNTTYAFGANTSGVGLDSSDRLILSNSFGSTAGGYYLSGGKIYTSAGTEVEGGYTVDGWFNVYQGDTYLSNLFFSADSPYYAYPNSYICMQTSSDNGKTWSSPELLNVKPNGTNWQVLGPGSGIITTSKEIAFTAYDGSNIYLIHGTSGNWKTVKTNAATNESSIVELSDGTIRAFVKNSSNVITYVDFTPSGDTYTAGSAVSTGVANTGWCMISSMMYSRQYQGQDVILVCCPVGSDVRKDGHLFAFTVADDKTMTQLGSYKINSGFFAYSDMAEMDDGSIALLYEDGCMYYSSGSNGVGYSHITYANLNLEEALGITFDEEQDVFVWTASNMDGEVSVGESAGVDHIHVEPATVSSMDVAYSAYNIVLCKDTEDSCTNGINCTNVYTGAVTVTLPLTDALKSASGVKGFVVETDGTITSINQIVSDGEYATFVAPHFSVVGIAALAIDEVTYENTESIPLYVGDIHTINLSDGITSGSHDSTVADVVWENISGTVSYPTAGIADDNAYADSTIDLNTCLYTFTASGTGYVIESTSVPGLYLNVTQNSVGYPNSTNSTTVSLSNGYLDNSFYLLCTTTGGTTNSDSYLHFYRDGKNYFDRVTDTTNFREACSFYLYRPVADGETASTEIPGFVQTTTVEEGKYLIAAYYNGSYYVLRPSTSTTSKYDHVAKVTGNTEESTTSGTEITINAKSEGSTSVVIGNTLYIITVSLKKAALTTYVGMGKTVPVSGNVTDADITAFNTKNGGTVTAAMADGSLTFTGVAAGTVTAILGNTEYTVTVNGTATAGDITDFNNIVGTTTYAGDNGETVNMTGKEIKALTIDAGFSFQLGVDITDADIVEWEVADSTIATVDPYGLVTANTAGETTVTATVIKDGIVETITIPIHVIPTLTDGTSTEIVTTFIYIEDLINTQAYYSLYSGSVAQDEQKLVPVIEGQVVTFHRPVDAYFGIIWTSTPNDGYALTYMAATGTQGHYYPLHKGDYVLVTDDSTYYAGGSTPYNNIVNGNLATSEELNATLTEATETNKCDGAMSMCRTNSSHPNMSTCLSFISEALPSVTKTVNGVLAPNSEGRLADWQTYYDGMYAKVGNYLYFTIDIRIDAPEAWEKDTDGNTVTDDYGPLAALKYNTGDSDGNATLTDTLSGAYFYTKDLDAEDGDQSGNGIANDDGYIVDTSRQKTIQDVTADMNRGWTDEEIAAGYRIHEYYVVYEIQADDVNKKITNNVALNYIYTSAYSNGTKSYSGSAEASMYVLGESLQDLVIDFGLPVQFTMTRTNLAHQIDQEKTNQAQGGALYGEVTIAQTAGAGTTDESDDVWTVTYTPDQILQRYDVVYLLDKDGKLVNYFRVYPATSVYYEEEFVVKSSSAEWSFEQPIAHSTMYQTLEKLSNTDTSGKIHPYGYDPIYAGTDAAYMSGSAKSYASTSTMGSSTEFTFTGTGFELYANCDTASGYVSVLNRGGSVVKLYAIDTHTGGEGAPTADQSGKFYSLPIVSVKNLDHGEYTVRVMKTYDSNEIQIDGVRIINTIADSSVFEVDKEDNPEFYQLRDYVLSAMNVGTSEQYGTVAEMIDQVYAGISTDTEAPTAAILANKAYDANVQDLLDNGPKNEVYLYKDQTLVFNVKTSRSLQIGLKAPQAATTYSIAYSYTVDESTTTIKAADNKALNTSVDMFYALGNEIGTERTYTITITNHGEKILSITDLKICDDPSAAFVELTPEDIEVTLRELGYIDDGETDSGENVPDAPAEPEIPVEPEITYADAVLNISMVDYRGVEISKTALQMVGVEGEINTFGAEQILTAAKAKLPSNYDFVDETSIADVDVVNGESKSIYIQIGKVATLKVTYISLFGRVLGSATIKKVQTSDGYCRFTAYDCKEYAPAGRYMLWVLPKYVPFGGYVSTAVSVI